MSQVDVLDLLKRADAAWERGGDAIEAMSIYERLLDLSAGSTLQFSQASCSPVSPRLF
jgi:hypothetical protein